MKAHLSRRYRFSASHRLHSEQMSDAENRATYGKCNNPHGHGHNYEIQVTLLGQPDHNGIIVEVPAFERTVDETVIRKFDHKNLNLDTKEFKQLNPTAENIVIVCFQLLRPHIPADMELQIRLYETPRNYVEYPA